MLVLAGIYVIFRRMVIASVFAVVHVTCDAVSMADKQSCIAHIFLVSHTFYCCNLRVLSFVLLAFRIFILWEHF